MARVYVRKFDWDEARRLRAEGWSYQAIAERLGVSASAVWQVLTGARRKAEYRERNREALRRLYRGKGSCADCGGPIWLHTARKHPRCTDCAAKRKTVTVRPDTLRCFSCGEWKPDALFPYSRSHRSRRGHHGACRACQAKVRQAHRERQKRPCEGCGRPALPPSEKGRRGRARVLCLDCYRASDEFKEAGRRAREASARRRRAA
jgi:hypothetical protein